MDLTWMKSRIAAHVQALAGEIGPRPSGSPANQLATDYLRMVLRATGVPMTEHPFECVWWEPGTATLQIGGAWIDVPPSPFSRPCDVRGRVTRLTSRDSLRTASPAPGRVIVIADELTQEPYLPKHFPFVDAPEQRAVLERIEALEPIAVIASVGEWNVQPMLEDGDLAFPYVALPAHVADRLHEDREVAVRIGGEMRPGTGTTISLRHGGEGRRILLCAHVDTKIATPGAFDNAGGVATLLALVEAGLPDDVPVEFVFFNGEDHYAGPGEQTWLAGADLDGIRHVVNLDGAGVVGHDTGIATMACPDELEREIDVVVEERPDWTRIPPWYESDHAIFAARGIPSIAITAAGAHDLASVIHTERDTPRMVDPAILAGVAGMIDAWLRRHSETNT